MCGVEYVPTDRPAPFTRCPGPCPLPADVVKFWWRKGGELMDSNEYIEVDGKQFKIPDIALGKVPPPKMAADYYSRTRI